MGRSIQERPVLRSGAYYHKASNRHYTIGDGRIARHQVDTAGVRVNVVEKPVSLAIGSGNHAITYVNRTAQGRLLEMPVSWYAKDGGYAMSPGYERSDHLDFRREISESCLFCHSNGVTPAPIGCERCHGDTEAHLRRPGRGNIVNPAKLSPQRQIEVCLQCHLETASSGMVDSLRRPGRAVFSYRPGEPLSEYKVYFDHERPDPARMEINHAGYRLLQSKCFLKSGGRMTCTTCHSPHTMAVRANACTQCHSEPHADGGCAGCHMPKRVAADAVHVEMTDHWIARRPAVSRPAEGTVRAFYGTADKSSLAFARGADVGVLRKMVARDPGNGPMWLALGNALLRSGDAVGASAALRRAVEADPKNTDGLMYLGVSAAVQGRHAAALEVLKRAVEGNPDHALSWVNLGATYEAMGDVARARAAYEEAVRLQPDSAEARRRLKAVATIQPK